MYAAQFFSPMCDAAWKRDRPIMDTAGAIVRGVRKRRMMPTMPMDMSKFLLWSTYLHFRKLVFTKVTHYHLKDTGHGYRALDNPHPLLPFFRLLLESHVSPAILSKVCRALILGQ